MNLFIKLPLVGAAAALSFCMAFAETVLDQSNIPAGLWERHAEGLELATILTSQIKNGARKHILKVYLKNTSSSIKEYISSGNDGGLQVFTLNDANEWVPLHDYGLIHYLGSATHTDIAPGEIIYRELELKPNELALIKAHALKVLFVVYDLTTMKKSVIESLPRQLFETVAPSSSK